MRLTQSGGQEIWVNPLLVRTVQPDRTVGMTSRPGEYERDGALIVFDGHWEDDEEDAECSGRGDYRDAIAVRESFAVVCDQLDAALRGMVALTSPRV